MLGFAGISPPAFGQKVTTTAHLRIAILLASNPMENRDYDAQAMTTQISGRIAFLPPSLPPRGLSRKESAAYIGVSPSLFDEMVKDGRMPRPKRINSRTVWDRKKLDAAFEAILDDEFPPGKSVGR